MVDSIEGEISYTSHSQHLDLIYDLDRIEDERDVAKKRADVKISEEMLDGGDIAKMDLETNRIEVGIAHQTQRSRSSFFDFHFV